MWWRLFLAWFCVLCIPSLEGFRRTPFSLHRSLTRSPTPVLGRSSTQLFVFDRLIRVITSNFNALLKRMEDPEKVIEQAVLDMQNDLVRIRQSYAEVSATQKRLERQRDTAQKEAEVWYRRAQVALQSGDEPLAKEALTRRQNQLQMVTTITNQLNIQGAATEKLYVSMQALENKIVEAKRQKETLIARARTAKTSLEVNNMLNELTATSNSMEAFTRMRDKVEALETEAEVTAELTDVSASQDLEERFKALDGETAVDRELAALKQQQQRLLPESTAVKQTPQQVEMLDADLAAEYEKLKRDMRNL